MPRATRLARATTLAVIITGVSACGSSSDDTSTSATTSTTHKAAKPQRDPGELRKSDFPKGVWPVTVNSGVVKCDGGAVTFTANGTTYAVNGTAMDTNPNMSRIDPIWKKDPAGYGLKIDISPILDTGLRLC